VALPLAHVRESANGVVSAADPSSAAVGISRPSRVSTNEGPAVYIWEQLYRAHYLDVVRRIQRMTRDRHAAEDLAQDAFLAVRRQLLAGRVSDPVAYLRMAAVNRARNWIRDRPDDVSIEASDESIADPRVQSAEAGMCAVTRKDAFLDGLRRLSPAQLGAYALVDLRGFTEREAAEVLGSSRSSVSTHRSRALISLKSSYLLADSC
jgi:RNA polymerase sigma factor (sigma-70 family)